MTTAVRTIHALYRYPVKGLSPEALAEVVLTPGRGFPLDRAWAITNGTAVFDAADPRPMPKTDFLVLMLHERLATLRTRFADAQSHLTIESPDGTSLEASLETSEGRARVAAFFADFLWDAVGDGAPEVVSHPAHRFTDVSVVSESMMHAVSLVNLASVRALEAAAGQPLDPLRFRANIYFDGGAAYEENDWVGREIALGPVRGRVVLRTQRCPATSVNPATAIRDLDVPAAIEQHFGHRDLGIYVELDAGGPLRTGDMLAPS
jgi:uncharacterized protein YcbX